jgi:hypothetical protein
MSAMFSTARRISDSSLAQSIVGTRNRAQPAGAVASSTGAAQAGPWQAPQASAGSLAAAGEAWVWVVLTGAFLDSLPPLKTLKSV